MAAMSSLNVSNNSATDKNSTKIQARVSRIESVLRPSTSKTGTENIHRAVETDATNSSKTMGTTTMDNNNTKFPLSEEHLNFVSKRLDSAPHQLELSTGLSLLQLTNPAIKIKATVEQPSRGYEQALELIAAFKYNRNESPCSRAGALFLEILNTDIRVLIYDYFVDTELEIIINPAKKYHSPLSALKATCKTTRDEINAWATRRKSLLLTPNPTFGLLNLPLTTFKFSWSEIDCRRKKVNKYQRCYSPGAAKRFLSWLEIWQRAMTLANSCDAADINHEIRFNEKLKYSDQVNDLYRQDIYSLQMLTLDDHDKYSFPAKFNLRAQDFTVLDPNKIKCDKDVQTYFRSPYVWSKDWDNHEVEQEYCFTYPEVGQGKWVRGIEACGSEALRNGCSWYHAFRDLLPWMNFEAEGVAFLSDDEEDIHLRGGDGDMMEVDDEDYNMGLGSEPDEDDNDLDMDHEEDEDMDREGDAEDTQPEDDDKKENEDQMETESTSPPTQQQPQQQQRQKITVTLHEATARRAVNRSVSLIDED
ncbi:hypothetical protein N431DRAFT_510141 [Stipitochalara longipes BDJ]|nr:hypothetical protein N431DRAFT_510141 [Stipitochalara longipes BDJ]